MRPEEQLFLHGLNLYHKKINLANFLKRVDEIDEEVTEIKANLDKVKGAPNGPSLINDINDSTNLLLGPATNDSEGLKRKLRDSPSTSMN